MIVMLGHLEIISLLTMNRGFSLNVVRSLLEKLLSKIILFAFMNV